MSYACQKCLHVYIIVLNITVGQATVKGSYWLQGCTAGGSQPIYNFVSNTLQGWQGWQYTCSSI